jgi:DNA-binding NarL/FixJ family response regulator
LLARAWPCVIELRIDDALATVAQFEDEIALADGTVAPQSREIAAVLRAVLLVLKSQDDATVRAAVAGFQDSILPQDLRPYIGSILARGAPQRTRTVLPREGTSRLTESLSPREHSILCSMSRGLSNKRIAQELQIAPETVKSHVKRIFIKLAVQSRAHAVSTAGALGML